jgi:acetyltransferase-like isoleucine patch superfamily enzyme
MYIYINNILSKFYLKIRNYHYKKVLGSFGKDSKVYGKITVYYPKNIFLGKNSTLNEGVLLNARAKINIGKYVHISPGVIINTGGLDYNKKGISRDHLSSPVNISDGVWIGSGVIINPGVTIGENSVIGAGAVVTKAVPANSVAVGVPAAVIKEI